MPNDSTPAGNPDLDTSARALLERSPTPVFIHRALHIVFANDAAARCVGRTRGAELEGVSLLDLAHQDDRARLVGSSGRREIRLLTRAGIVTPAEIEDVALQFEGAPAVAIFARDLEERNDLRARLALADRMAMLGTISASVAHELNTPIAFMLANIALLQEELARDRGASPRSMSDRQARVAGALEHARLGADRVRGIVQDLKGLSRDNGDSRAPVDVRRVLESSIRMASSEIADKARLVVDIKPIPPAYANEGSLGQVFVNLLVNAAQAIDSGQKEENEIRVSTSVSEGHVVVTIRDTGAGIPEGLIDRVFEPFVTTKPGAGTGLGLSICKEILNKLGGEISVASDGSGRGATFRITLPIPPSEATTSENSARVGSAPTRRGRVLVVDDEPMIGVAIRRALASQHDVVAVTSARAALDILSSGDTFDTIFCDVMMPGMTGVQLVEELRASAHESADRVVFLSGGAHSPATRSALLAARVRMVEKPFESQLLKSIVRDFVNTR